MSAQLIRIGSHFSIVILMVHNHVLRKPIHVPALLPRDADYYGSAMLENDLIPTGGLCVIPHGYARVSLTIPYDSWGNEEEFVGMLFDDLTKAHEFVLAQRSNPQPPHFNCRTHAY